MKRSKKTEKQILADKNQRSINLASNKNDPQKSETKNILNPAEKKTPKWFYAFLFSLPITFLIILEISLRLINYGDNYDQWVDVGEGKFQLNSNIGKKYFPNGDFSPKTSADYFDLEKKENSFRVFVLGESSAEGFPYSPMGSFARYIRRRLELVYPQTQIEVVNLGMTAINSYTLLDLLPGVLDQKPDLILIYTGHNEYYGSLGVGSVQSAGSSRTLIELSLYLNKFKITQFIRNSIHWALSLFSSENKKLSGTLMSRIAKDKYILFNSDEYNAGLEQFKANFTEIVRMIKNKGVPVILGKLVSNLKDQKPFISADTPGYKNADQVFEEATEACKNKSTKADSLFRLAKDLDALRFRAPEKINKIIDDLGKEFNVTTVPLDSLFNSESPGGVVGDNLVVDHLHPNVKGYQNIGNAFYNTMEKLGYLPKSKKENIPFAKQDSLTRANFVFTKLDSTIGNYNIILLKSNWPYVKKSTVMSEFQTKDFVNLFHPKDLIDSIAMLRVQGLSWDDAHLLAAKTYLKRDDIENYLVHMNVLLYQYSALKDFNTVLTYFYKQNKIDMSDYTTKRVGIISLQLGKIDDAIKYLTECYQANPNDPLVLFNLSLAFLKKKDFKNALAIINHCLIVNPNYIEAKNLKRQILSR